MICKLHLCLPKICIHHQRYILKILQSTHTQREDHLLDHRWLQRGQFFLRYISLAIEIYRYSHQAKKNSPNVEATAQTASLKA